MSKLNRFWKIYLISVLSAVCLVAVGLSVFYAFIDSYEKSQPEYAVQTYANELSEKTLSELVMDALPEELSVYESHKDLNSYYMLALDKLEGQFTVRKDYKNYSSAKPVFNIIKDSVPIVSLTLTLGEDGAFGMKRWKTESVCALLENWTSPAQDYTFYVPVNAALTINNVAVRETDKTDSDIPYAFTSVYEPNSSAKWDVYTVSDLRAVPVAECTFNDAACPVESTGNVFLIKYPESAQTTYTLTVPTGAVVSVNGIALTEKEIVASALPYKYSQIESDLSDLPTAVSYSVSGLFGKPSAKAVLEDTELTFTEEGSVYTASYPTNLQYTCTLQVPAGSTVKIHGVDCSSYKTGQETAYAALSAHVAALPVFDVYTVSGLYASPSEGISVNLDGKELPVIVHTDGYTVTARAGFASVENNDINDRAVAFVKDYITYTGQGYNNLDANLQRVLSYVIPYTEAYSRIANSRIGIYYVTPVTANEYKKLEVSNIVKYNDDMYECTVDFDVMQKTYYVQNDYAGQIQLLFIKKNGVWKVADMQIDSK